MLSLDSSEALTLSLRVGAGCNIALYYNTAFCYLMQRRYLDAARAFNTGLAYINRCQPC